MSVWIDSSLQRKPAGNSVGLVGSVKGVPVAAIIAGDRLRWAYGDPGLGRGVVAYCADNKLSLKLNLEWSTQEWQDI